MNRVKLSLTCESRYGTGRLGQLGEVERLEQRARAPARYRRSARAAEARRGGSARASARSITSAIRSSFASSTMKRGSTLRRVGNDAQPQAGGAAAVGHRLAHVDHLDAADRAVAGDVPLDPAPHRRSLARLARHDQRRLAVGRRDQLRVEQIGADRVGERHVGGRHFDIFEARRPAARSAAISASLSAKACSCANSTRSLATATTSLWKAPAAIASSDCSAKSVALRIEPVQPRDRLRRLEMLARREGAAATRHRRRPRRPARRARGASRMWLAAPSSPKAGGTGPWTAKASLAKASRSCASVAGHSWLRCGMVRRLATVRWHLPSAVSGAGETVAALAAHIAEADMALAASAGSASSMSCRARASQARSGRGCGRKMPCARPSAEVGAHLVDALQRRGARLRHLARHCASRRGCRGSARHNCGSARRSRRN